MTRLKKVLLVLLLLVILSQIPFAYRRYRLGRLHAAILSLNSLHQSPNEPDGFKEYVGVMHVHSFLGGHSAGTFQELIAAASADHLNFVLMTEHTAVGYPDRCDDTQRGS